MDSGLANKLVGIMLILAIVLLIYDAYIATLEITDPLTRGNKDQVSELSIETKYAKEDYDFTIKAMHLTEEEINEMFQQALKEIEDSVFSLGDTQDHVSHDLNIKDSYVDGKVSAQWQFSDYKVIRTDGSINQEMLTEEGMLITVRVTLSCQKIEYVHSFFINVYELDSSSYEGFMYKLKIAIDKANEDSITEEIFNLPREIEGEKLIWRRKMDFRGIKLIFLSLTAAVSLRLGEKEEKRRQEKERERLMLIDYPVIVSNLSILMGAGISFKGALERMVNRYQKDIKLHPGMEQMVITYHEITDGVGERKALENLAKRSKVKEYRKLSMLLLQNMKKGSSELIEMLEKEDIYGFEMRKQMALKSGEEASTKLLLPMGGMLGVVIVILVVPAFMSMNL